MGQPNQFALLSQHRFAPFFWTQFLGAFNDNIFKTALMTALTFQAVSWSTADPGLLNNLIPGLFILPYVVLSATAGQLADKFEKSRLTRYIKLFEIAIMCVAAVGWMLHSLPLLIAAVVGMGAHSTMFGPVKYAYLPQHLKREELVGGNGVVEMGTFIGILLGEIAGAVLVVHDPWGVELVAGGTIAVAILGWLASRRIPLTPAPAPALRINWNPLTETVRNLRFSRSNRAVFLSLLGNSWFWFYGAILLAQFPVYAKETLHGNHGVFVLLLTIFSLGIGTGSLLCERLSGPRVEIGLVPFGSIGLSLFGVDLFLASVAYVHPGAGAALDVAGFLGQHGSIRILFDCLMIGIFGGLYVVPLFAVIQTRCDPAHVSRTIAGMNIMNALFMVSAALLGMLLLKAGLTIPQLFLVTALLNAVVALYIFSVVPEFLLRFVAWLLIHTLYRVRRIDTGRIPHEGAAVLVCNHVSYIDAVVIMAASPRPIRFVMDHQIFAMPVLSWIFRTAKAIPIAAASVDPILARRAFDAIALALDDGELVCIFPEGALTRTGEINPFKAGVHKIVQRSPVPIVPMALRGLWSSIYSRRSGGAFERGFRRGPRSQLALAVGLPVDPALATPELLQQLVQALRGDHR